MRNFGNMLACMALYIRTRALAHLYWGPADKGISDVCLSSKLMSSCNCERSEQSLTKVERPGQTNTNWWPKMSIRKYLEWRVSQQGSTLFPQNLRFRWGLIAFTLKWAKTGVFIQIFTIILEYKNWAANTWCKSLEHHVDEYYQWPGVWYASGVWNPPFPLLILTQAFWDFFLD